MVEFNTPQDPKGVMGLMGVIFVEKKSLNVKECQRWMYSSHLSIQLAQVFSRSKSSLREKKHTKHSCQFASSCCIP